MRRKPQATRRDKRREPTLAADPLWLHPRHGRYWALWLLVLVIYVALRFNTIAIPLDRDEGVFGYAGQVILSGGLPYLDVVDHKPPVVFYAYALALLVVPPTATGIHLFFQGLNFVTLVILFLVAKAWTGRSATGFWAAFAFAVLSSSPAIQGFTASTEMLLLLPLSASLLLALLASRRQRAGLALASGACAALVFFTKQTAAPILLFVFLLVALARPLAAKTQRYRYTLAPRLLLAWLLGSLVVGVVVVGFFLSQGLFSEFLYWSFSHNLAYSAQMLPEKLSFLAEALAEILASLGLIVFAAAIFASVVATRKRRRSYLPAALLLLSFAAVLPGYAYPHYFAQLVPSLALVGAVALSAVTRWAQTRGLPTWAPLACAALVLAQPVVVNPDHYIFLNSNESARELCGGNPFPESLELARYLAERTDPQEQIFISGSEPQILLMAQRRSSTPFVMIYPLTSAYPRHQEFQELVWRDIQTALPAFILMVNIPTSLGWDGRADLSLWDRLPHLLRERFRLEAAMTVEGSKGRILGASELQALPGSGASIDEFPIRIFRRVR